MRLRGGGGAAAALLAAFLALVGIAQAKPNFLSKEQRPEEQPATLTQTLSSLEEHQCPDNILDKWLDEQEPWHILGDLGVDEEEQEEDEGEDAPFPEVHLQNLEEDDVLGQHVEEQEEDQEAEEKKTPEAAEDTITSPVSLDILGRSEGLLNPRKDYEVFVISDIATTARILLVLDNYLQMSTCGVGGFRKVEGSEDMGSQYALSPDYLRIGVSSDYDDDDKPYVPSGRGMNSSISVGECFWWAEGLLVGGDEVSVEYTPPECGCVMLSVYAAFETQDTTLVSGPNPKSGSQSELLCVGRTAHNEVEDKADAEEHLVQLQDESPSPQDATDVVTLSNDLTDGDDNDDDNDGDDVVATPQPVESKEKRRKKWRQRIRKNRRKRGRCTKRNWWKCRKNKAARLNKSKSDLQEKDNEDGDGEASDESQAHPHKKNHGKVWKKRRQHKRKRGWRKNHRHHKKARKAKPNKCTRWRRRRGLCKVTEVPEGQDKDADTSNETESSQEPGAEFRNQEQTDEENEDLFALLLGPEGEDTTILEQEEQEEQEVSETHEGEEEGGREGRKLKTKKPLMNQRKVRRMLPPGKKFCCKQGITTKKTTAPIVANPTSPTEDLLLMTPAPENQQEAQEEEGEEGSEEEEEEDGVCLEAPQEVTTWARYKLKIDPIDCEIVYKTCCTKFNVEWWLGERQRKQERKERRKKILQQKWEKKKEKRQQKKTERKAKMAAKKSKLEARKAKWNAKAKSGESHEVVD